MSDTPDMLEALQEFLDLDFSKVDIATMLGVDRKTIYRWIQKHGLEKLSYSTLPDEEIVQLIYEIKLNHPNDGEVLMDGHLRARGIKIQRWKLREALHLVDPEGIKARTSVTIKRREYKVPFPHYLWHADGDHKLIKYKMVIHGCVDGFTRYFLYIF